LGNIEKLAETIGSWGNLLSAKRVKLSLVNDMDSLPTTLTTVQKTVNDWVNQFEEGYWPPLSMLAAITEEVGELSREINHREGYKKKRDGSEADLGLELADVLFSLVCIANYYHVDLEEAFKSVMAKYTKRDTDRGTKKKQNSNQNILEP
jgi:NTP pyrophosphatase (non-canonical NTP hydrolase)